MYNSISFDASTVPNDFETVPAGTYRAMITSAQVKRTKAGNGAYLGLVFTLCNNDEYEGRKIYHMITFDHPNPDTVRIAKEHLKKLCVAIGSGNALIDDPEVFVGHTIAIKVIVKGNEDSDIGLKNSVQHYFPF